AAIPELPPVEHRVQQRRRISNSDPASDSLGHPSAIGECALGIVTRCTAYSAVRGKKLVEEELASKLDFRRSHRIVIRNKVGPDIERNAGGKFDLEARRCRAGICRAN